MHTLVATNHNNVHGIVDYTYVVNKIIVCAVDFRGGHGWREAERRISVTSSKGMQCASARFVLDTRIRNICTPKRSNTNILYCLRDPRPTRCPRFSTPRGNNTAEVLITQEHRDDRTAQWHPHPLRSPGQVEGGNALPLPPLPRSRFAASSRAPRLSWSQPLHPAPYRERLHPPSTPAHRRAARWHGGEREGGEREKNEDVGICVIVEFL